MPNFSHHNKAHWADSNSDATTSLLNVVVRPLIGLCRNGKLFMTKYKARYVRSSVIHCNYACKIRWKYQK